MYCIGRIRVTFIDKEGDEHTYEVAKGDNLLDIAQSEDLEMEGEPCSLPSIPKLPRLNNK